MTTPRPLAPAPPLKESALRRLTRIEVPKEADLVILGDSNAAAWPPDLLEAALPGRRVFNFGLPGDRVQNTLWRLDTCDTSHLRPRDVIVVIGTNNLADGDAPEAIVGTISALIERIAAIWNNPRILLPTVARRYASPLARNRERETLNELLLTLAAPGTEIARSDLILDELGAAAFEPDGIHIGRLGYARLSEALARFIDG